MTLFEAVFGSGSMDERHVAVDPRSGQHLRPATKIEIEAYKRANSNKRRGAERPVNVGSVLINTFYGPGHWHGGAGF